LQYWWFPKGTSPEVISYFTDILNQAMQTDYVRARLDELSILPQIITGDKLRKRIDSRMKAFAEMTIIDRVALPNVVGWTLGAILVFGLGLVRKLWVDKNKMPEEASGLSLRFDLVWIVLAAVAFYVLVMAMGWVSFVWATLLFTLFCCASLGCITRRSWLYVCEISLLVSFGVHVVFTQIFLITLP
jgi:putative tricarboxylic transport membrane protein